MSDERILALPFAPHRIEILHQPLVEAPQPALAHDADTIRAVDAVFTQREEPTDAALGLMGLSLSAPWLIDLLAEQLRLLHDAEMNPREKD